MNTLTEIFRPRRRSLLLTLLLAAFWHVWLIEGALRKTAAVQLTGAHDFWAANFVRSLPYLETDSTILKFITFFVVSYLVVWIASVGLRGADHLQNATIRKLRRSA